MAVKQYSAAELLALAETMSLQNTIGRILTLLSIATPLQTQEELLQLSLGQSNMALLKLREQLFGCSVVSITTCSHCRESIEINLNTRSLYQQLHSDQVLPVTEIPFHFDDYRGSFRLLTNFDLVAIAKLCDVGSAAQKLVQRCLLSLKQNEDSIAIDQIPANVLAGLEAALLAVDPLAEIQLDLCCPSCNQHSQAIFDIADFLADELQQKAWQILADIHTLALAYKWSEADILALSDTRRDYYLKRIQT